MVPSDPDSKPRAGKDTLPSNRVKTGSILPVQQLHNTAAAHLVLGDLADPILMASHRGRLAAFRHDYIVAQHSKEVCAAELSGGHGEAGNRDAFLILARRLEHLMRHGNGTTQHDTTPAQRRYQGRNDSSAVRLAPGKKNQIST